MNFDIEGNGALVTGSSSGLGKASAKTLVREGVNVVINGRDETNLEAAVEDIETAGPGHVIGVTGDLTDPETPEILVGEVLNEFDRFDHLVTSIGGPPSYRILDIPEQEWYNAFESLVMSVVRLVNHSAEPLSRDGGGTIVTITSRVVKEAVQSNPLSSAVRMSVIGIDKILSKDLAPEVRINAVLPGAHDTPRIRELSDQAVDRGEFPSISAALDHRSQNIPLQRLGDPMELGNTVAFLSSPRSGFINGTTITIDGGQSSATL